MLAARHVLIHHRRLRRLPQHHLACPRRRRLPAPLSLAAWVCVCVCVCVCV